MANTITKNRISLKELPKRIDIIEDRLDEIKELIEESELFFEAFTRTRNEPKVSLQRLKERYNV